MLVIDPYRSVVNREVIRPIDERGHPARLRGPRTAGRFVYELRKPLRNECGRVIFLIAFDRRRNGISVAADAMEDVHGTILAVAPEPNDGGDREVHLPEGFRQAVG